MPVRTAFFSTGESIAACLIVYFLMTRLPMFFPISALTPYHIDFWAYFNGMTKPLQSTDFMIGRPLSLVFVRFLGLTGVSENEAMLLFSGLSLLAIVASIIACESIAGHRAKIEVKIAYVLIVMTLPTFFVIHQWDFGGTIATILFCGAIINWKLRRYTAVTSTLILVWIGFEFKPTWMASSPLFFFSLAVIGEERKKNILMTMLAVTIGIGVLTKDWLLGSVFIDVAGSATSPYAISRFAQIVPTLMFYIFNMATIPSGIAFLAIFVMYKIPSRNIFIVICIAVGAIIPMAMLPNKLMPMYSWYASLFLFSPFILVTEPREIGLVRFGITGVGTISTRYLTLITVISGIILYSLAGVRSTADREFYRQAQQRIALEPAVIRTINHLPDGAHVLIGAILTPFSSFNNYAYIRRKIKTSIQPTFLVSVDMRPFTTLLEPAQMASPQNISLYGYDYIVNFSTPQGTPELKKVSELSDADLSSYKMYLSCPEFSRLRTLPDDNMVKLINQANCYIDTGEPANVISLIRGQWSAVKNNEWAYWVLGNAYDALHDCPAALHSYRQALSINPSAVFANAADRVAAKCGG